MHLEYLLLLLHSQGERENEIEMEVGGGTKNYRKVLKNSKPEAGRDAVSCSRALQWSRLVILQGLKSTVCMLGDNLPARQKKPFPV